MFWSFLLGHDQKRQHVSMPWASICRRLPALDPRSGGAPLTAQSPIKSFRHLPAQLPAAKRIPAQAGPGLRAQ